jgi:outer membrane lipoprotein-sorting protein
MNRTHLAAGLVGLATAILCATAANAATLEEIEKKIEAASKKINSYAGKSESKTEMDMGGGNSSKTQSEATFEWMRDDKDNKKQYYRSEAETVTEMVIGDNKTKAKTKVLSIADGQFVYSLSETDGNKSAVKMKWDPKTSSDPTSVIATLKKDHDCKVLPDAKVGKFDCYVIEARPKKKEDNPTVSKMVYSFEKESGIAVLTVIYDAKGRKMSETTVKEFKINPNLSKDRFKFKLPEGVQLVDMTKMQEDQQADKPSDDSQAKTDTEREDKPKETAEKEEETKPEKKDEKKGLGGLLNKLK